MKIFDVFGILPPVTLLIALIAVVCIFPDLQAKELDKGKQPVTQFVRSELFKHSRNLCHFTHKLRQAPICKIESLYWFPDENLAVVTYCYDSSGRDAENGFEPLDMCGNILTYNHKPKKSNAVMLWRVTNIGITLIDHRYSDMSDSVDTHNLGIVRSPIGKLLIIPIQMDGTGSGNLSSWYLLENDKLTSILDHSLFREDLVRLLPKSAELWKGIWPNPYIMGNNNVPTYRNEDANCCPTNGQMTYRLKLSNGKLRIDWLKYRPPVALKNDK